MKPAVKPPPITPVPAGGGTRPFWSVVIPTYNAPAGYLETSLSSVLEQSPGLPEMEILVVDDCSPAGSSEALVRRIGGGRILFCREPKNLGLAGIWNRCIAQARGEWIHILHQDDYVLPGFFQTLRDAARQHPEISLMATRSFFVDEHGVITGVSPRVPELEMGSQSAKAFFYGNPVLCPGVVIKRSFYETHGGFRSDLSYTLDYEMWVRAIARSGGLVRAEVLSCHRIARGSETGRLARTAENLRDLLQVGAIFGATFDDFDPARFERVVARRALEQGTLFRSEGDPAAAAASHLLWRELTPWTRRCEVQFRRLLRRYRGADAN